MLNFIRTTPHCNNNMQPAGWFRQLDPRRASVGTAAPEPRVIRRSWPQKQCSPAASCSRRETANVVLFYDLDNSTSTDMSTFCVALAGINRYCNRAVNTRVNTQTNIHWRTHAHARTQVRMATTAHL